MPDLPEGFLPLAHVKNDNAIIMLSTSTLGQPTPTGNSLGNTAVHQDFVKVAETICSDRFIQVNY